MRNAVVGLELECSLGVVCKIKSTGAALLLCVAGHAPTVQKPQLLYEM